MFSLVIYIPFIAVYKQVLWRLSRLDFKYQENPSNTIQPICFIIENYLY